MIWHSTKSTFIVLLILIGFIFLLLLPRELEITHVHGLVYTANYPFSFELYKQRIHDFFHYLQSEKGLGETKTGVPVLEEAKRLLSRDLIIIIPCFIFSIIIGTFFGIVQFYFREKIFGKLLSMISWMCSSIPDFFLFIAIQYVLIKLMKSGFPHFHLYGNEHWYSFMIPLIALTLFPMIHISKYISLSLENENSQEYVRTSYAKGLSRLQVLLHMLQNCMNGLLNQSQVVMVYILTSLPIIEKLSSYRGAGYQLLQSILENEDNTALAYMIPFLFIMLFTILTAQIFKHLLLPPNGGELE